MKRLYCLLYSLLLLKVSYAQPSPEEHFGFQIGKDYHLATFDKTESYFKLLGSNPRARLVEIGKTEEGRSQFMLIVSSPENIRDMERYREISQKLARAEDLTEPQARELSREGKAIVWIDGGLHATETLGIHQLIETAWQLVSRGDEETRRILDNTIILMTHANPDGQQLVSSWYMREPIPEKRSLQGVPKLYQKYAGHDNNRDFFMLNLRESRNIARQLFVDWIPQIMYNHHQSGPAGSVVAGAPYRDPFNYVFDPILMTSIDALGAAMNTRLNAENKPGYTQKYGSVFSTWYNGGLRTTTYFHNIIGLLTETIGGPNPSEIPLVPSRLIPNGGTPFPVRPQKWHFRQSIDYSVSLNYAVLDHAARYRDEILFNMFRMGKNSIEKGRSDTWSLSPKKVDAINSAFEADQKDAQSRRAMSVKYYDTVMRNPAERDPRGYIIPADQDDFPTAVKFVNALIRTGILVHRAGSNFQVKGKNYPRGSFIIKTDQAFRPHVLDMFEPQDHPNDFQYPGGPPVAPYDAAGWTLAYLMDLKFDRFLDDFEGPFERIPYGELQDAGNQIPESGNFLISARSNNAFAAVNALLEKKQTVYRIKGGENAGDFYIPANDRSRDVLRTLKTDAGLVVKKSEIQPKDLLRVKQLRIALWDTYGGSMPSGWIRWLAEQYHFEAKVIYAGEIDAGKLHTRYDVIILPPGAVPSARSNQRPVAPGLSNIPSEYQVQLGNLTIEKSIPSLRSFLNEGGKIMAIGSSTNLAYLLDLPVRNHLVEIDTRGETIPLRPEKYYIPGSVLRVGVNGNSSATWGFSTNADVYFNNSPVFRISPQAISDGKITPILWFDNDAPLRSGWAWGQPYLKDGVTAFEARIGKGKLYAFGPEITFRAQSHGTFKLLFNQLIGQTE